MQRKLHKDILRLAIPSILANSTIPLVGMVDVAIIGHISSAVAVAGIAVGTMLFDLLYWNFGFLRITTGGLTAQAFGRNDRPATFAILRRSLSWALLSALLCIAIQWFFVEGVLHVMPCSPEVAAFARRYFYIRIWAAPATLSLMALKGWFIGMQNTVAPMATDIVVNLVNMLASYLLAVGLPSNLSPITLNLFTFTPSPLGVAWGTLIAQYTGLILALLILLIKYRPTFTSARLSADLSARNTLRLNRDYFIRSLCFMVVYVGYTVVASTYGDAELAVSNILMKLFMLFSYFVDGFAYAGEALVGKEIGHLSGTSSSPSDLPSALRPTVRTLFVWCIAVGLLFSLLYGLFAPQLVGLLTTDALLRQTAAPYSIWLALMPLISSLAFMWDGIYFGATRSVDVRNCMLFSAAAAALGYILTFAFLPLAHSLYVAYSLHLIARTLYLSLRWRPSS